ncbi:MAG: TonB-dependent receptor plug domain-containing protein, partial [Gammaproteobacteria bacterium]
MLKLYACLAGVLGLVIAFQSHAAEENVENIVVSGIRYETTATTIPASISVITAEDIARSGASHLMDILRSHGALQISDLFGDGTDASVGLRGFSSTAQHNTLIMVDGRRLNNADNSLPDLNTVALSNIDRIEIVKSSMGSLYGDKAVGGVVNIITRSPDALDINLQADYGSYDYRALFAGLENRHDNGLSYRFSAGRRLREGYRDHNDLRLTDLSTRAAYTHINGEVFVEYQDVNEHFNLPGPLFRDQLAADRRQALNPDDHIQTETRAGRVGIRQTVINGLELLAEYTNRHSDSEGRLSSAGNPALFTTNRRHQELTPRLIAILP